MAGVGGVELALSQSLVLVTHLVPLESCLQAYVCLAGDDADKLGEDEGAAYVTVPVGREVRKYAGEEHLLKPGARDGPLDLGYVGICQHDGHHGVEVVHDQQGPGCGARLCAACVVLLHLGEHEDDAGHDEVDSHNGDDRQRLAAGLKQDDVLELAAVHRLPVHAGCEHRDAVALVAHRLALTADLVCVDAAVVALLVLALELITEADGAIGGRVRAVCAALLLVDVRGAAQVLLDGGCQADKHEATQQQQQLDAPAHSPTGGALALAVFQVLKLDVQGLWSRRDHQRVLGPEAALWLQPPALVP
mmetsp:Transcript_2027/g.4487  ORF Transcript_2027/g.4487 Transcript_2027/m.4487 type:complete len:305 (+) Transcript_2027:1250-2164(+)